MRALGWLIAGLGGAIALVGAMELISPTMHPSSDRGEMFGLGLVFFCFGMAIAGSAGKKPDSG